MKNVLVTTDFSPDSRYTLDYVLDFLSSTAVEGRVLLLNTYNVELKTDPSQLVSMNDALKKRSKTLLDEEVKWARAHYDNPKLTIEAASHMGTLNNVVINLLRNENIDLVAMGKGSGNHVEQLSALLKDQKCPILITHKPSEE